jgi:hypothetical protein
MVTFDRAACCRRRRSGGSNSVIQHPRDGTSGKNRQLKLDRDSAILDTDADMKRQPCWQVSGVDRANSPRGVRGTYRGKRR